MPRYQRERNQPTAEAVCDCLGRALARLERGAVDPEGLVVRQRVSKSVDAYSQRTRAVAALERAADHGLERPPGTSVKYVVVDECEGDRREPSRATRGGAASRGAERVRLPFEDVTDHDTEFYRKRLVRAAESVVSPLGWDRGRI